MRTKANITTIRISCFLELSSTLLFAVNHEATKTPTVRIGKDQHIWTYSAEMEAVITVDPGTVIEIGG